MRGNGKEARPRQQAAAAAATDTDKSAISSPLVVYPGGVVIERVEKGRLELDLHGVVRLGALLLDVHDPAKPTLADPLDVQEVVRAHLKHQREQNNAPEHHHKPHTLNKSFYNVVCTYVHTPKRPAQTE